MSNDLLNSGIFKLEEFGIPIYCKLQERTYCKGTRRLFSAASSNKLPFSIFVF